MDHKIIHLDDNQSDADLLSLYIMRIGISPSIVARLENLAQLQEFLDTLDVASRVIFVLDGNFPSSLGEPPQFNLPKALEIILGYRENVLGIVVWSAEDIQLLSTAVTETDFERITIQQKTESGKLEPLARLICSYLN